MHQRIHNHKDKDFVHWVLQPGRVMLEWLMESQDELDDTTLSLKYRVSHELN